MALTDFIKDNPLIRSHIQSFNKPKDKNEVSKDSLIEMGKAGKLTHLGGKIPDFLKGFVQEAKELAKTVMGGGTNTIEVQGGAKPTPTPTPAATPKPTVQPRPVPGPTPTPPRATPATPAIPQVQPAQPAQPARPIPEPINVARAVDSLVSHESRGAVNPAETASKSAGAIGISQITPIMVDRYNQITNGDLTSETLSGNARLQRVVTEVLVGDIMNRYKNGLDTNWPTSNPQLQKYKQEIMTNFTQPIHWLAGEWVAGPNWVAKLDSPTAPGARETVRDYINRVAEIYGGSNNSLTLNR